MDRFDRAHMAKLLQSLAFLLHTMPPSVIDASRTHGFAMLVASLMIMQVIVAFCSDAIWRKAPYLVVASGCIAFVAGFIWTFS